MNQEEKLQIQERIVDVLKTVYDPEIPVDIWNLGMIYKIEVNDVFEPVWDQSMMSEEAKVELGFA